jgi:putative hemolysin
MSAAIGLLIAAVLLVAAASAIEVILFGLPYARSSELEAEGVRGARALAALRARPAGLLATTWLVRVAGAAIAALAVWDAARLVSDASLVVGLVGVVVAIVLVVLAEFAGKSVAQRAGERAALRIASPIRIVSKALLPVTWPAELIVRMLAPKFTEILPGISDREIRDLVSPGNGEAVIEEHERRLIERAFLLDQTTAYDIAPELRSARYSRVPVYSESIDRITGVLYLRDAYMALISGQHDVELRALAREPFFVPGSITLDKLLLDFQARRIHLGIVIDEYGGVDGLVTLEDILEELVGEIIDESDVAQEPIVRLGRNEILVDGSADLREINHFFNTSFPLLEHRSLNGYLLEVCGQVPQPGERISREGVVIEVTAATDTQVLRARISRGS